MIRTTILLPPLKPIIMKWYFLFLLFSFCTISTTYAQLPTPPTVDKGVNIGQLVTQVASALKPSSFTDAWGEEKSNWTQSAQNLTEPKGIANSISTLAGYIKPGLFKQGFSAETLLNMAQSVTDLAGAAGLLKGFEGGLKPEAFTPEWSGQRSGWLKALDLIK